MKILFVLLAFLGLLLAVLAAPTARHVAILQRTVLGCGALVVGLWVWPDGVGALGAALLLYAALWLLGRWLLWPLHYLAALLRQ